MRILAVYRHYWPDTTPYARLLKVILEQAAAEGHAVTAYSAQPSYNDATLPPQPRREGQGGVAIRRVRLLPERKRWRAVRLVNSLLFLAKAAWHAVVQQRYDVIVANGHPPVLMGLALRLVRMLTGTPYVLHLQDIHPECLAAVGRLPRGLRYRWLRALDTSSCRGAVRLVTLSDEMAASLVNRGLDRRQIVLIQNAPLRIAFGEATGEAPPALKRTGDETILLFAGNLGDFQALDLVVDAAVQASRARRLKLVLLGTGSARQHLMDRAGSQLGRSICFVDRVPTTAAIAAMQVADYGIVSLSPGVSACAFPSKSMTLLAAGCPLLVVAETHSDLSQIVRRERLGLTAGGYSVEQVADLLRSACDRRDEWTSARRNEIQAAGQRLFGEPQMLAAWSALWADLSCELAAAPTPAFAQHRKAA